jgi:hypothetical protein
MTNKELNRIIALEKRVAILERKVQSQEHPTPLEKFLNDRPQPPTLFSLEDRNQSPAPLPAIPLRSFISLVQDGDLETAIEELQGVTRLEIEDISEIVTLLKKKLNLYKFNRVRPSFTTTHESTNKGTKEE